MKFLILLLFFVIMPIGSAAVPVKLADSALRVDLKKYPIMTDREVGHLRYAIKTAQQELDDFSLVPLTEMYHIKGSGEKQAAMSSARYTISFMTYFLALEQFSKLPAYTDLIQPNFDRLIQKMQQRTVWSYWAEVSRGVPMVEPNMDSPYPEEHDPVANRNIMYSGHLAHMISLYEKIYRDFKWANPKSIDFAWSDKEHYYYDTHSLHKVIYDQYVKTADHAIECSPNMAFPVCNQHPIIALMLYDQTYNTSYFPTASRLHLQFYMDNQIIDPDNHTVAAMLLVKQHTVINREPPRFGNKLDMVMRPLTWMHLIGTYTAAVDGWNGAFMNSWAPEMVNDHYPFQKKEYVVVKNDKMAYIVNNGVYEQISAPFFAVLAAEMGDLKLRDQLLSWSEKKFKAKWDKEGNFFYPPGYDMPFTVWPSTRFRGIPLTDKLAALASANGKDGLRKMHLNPFPGADETTPKVVDVSSSVLTIKRAIYDAELKALIVTTKPFLVKRLNQTNFRVTRLDPNQTWDLYVDGHKVTSYPNVIEATIPVNLDGQHDIVLQAEQAP